MNNGLRVLILTPDAFPAICGNAVTVERWRRSLTEKGVTVTVLPSADMTPERMRSVLETSSPHIIHAHHIIKTGRPLLDPMIGDRIARTPLVISPSGTDLTIDLNRGELVPVILDVCRRARAILTQSDHMTNRLVSQDRNLASKITYVQKAFMWFGDRPFDLRQKLGFTERDVVFLLPAGIRPVKGNLECLDAFRILHDQLDRARIVFAGPPIDRDYAGRFAETIDRARPWAQWLPLIPVDAMRSAYMSADIIVNASRAEGLSNVVLEAMAAGRPLLASNIPGNNGLIGRDNKDQAGLTFDPSDPGDFVEKAARLVTDISFRETLGRIGFERATLWPSPEDEAEAIMTLYEAVGREQKTPWDTGPDRRLRLPEEEMFQEESRHDADYKPVSCDRTHQGRDGINDMRREE